jgi:acyl-CoA synthetase (AMP-forming)/AMP-acid ligase II
MRRARGVIEFARGAVPASAPRGSRVLQTARPHPHQATTIPEWLDALTAEFGDADCVTSESGSLSFRCLDDASAALARGLLARGVGKGTRVGLLLGNGVEWVIWWAAISRIGALCVPLSTFLQPAELGRVVRHGDLHLLATTRHFLGRDFEQIVADALPSLARAAEPELVLPEAPYLRSIVLDESDAAWALAPNWLLDAGADPRWSEVLTAAQREVHTTDEAICIYTSGQSADPKGVVHTQGAVVEKAHYLRYMFNFTETPCTDVTMPFFWVGGLVMALFPTMDAGGVTNCTERSTWGSGAVIGNARSATTPTQVPIDTYLKVPALGMTETFGMYSWGDEPPVAEYPIAAPLDQLQPGFELRLVDESGQEVPDGVPGEILVRGPTVTTRLQKVPRSEAFDADGFYRTGDRGIRHGSRVNFLGRIGDMIKTSGANVSPAEVERELLAIDGVAVAHVVALDDARRGQMVGAAIIPVEGAQLTPEGVKEQLRGRLSVYKVPKAIAVLDSNDEVPMTPSMKVRKRELAALITERSTKGTSDE